MILQLVYGIVNLKPTNVPKWVFLLAVIVIIFLNYFMHLIVLYRDYGLIFNEWNFYQLMLNLFLRLFILIATKFSYFY